VNTTQQARTAYTAAARPIRTARGTEYEAFAGITSRLRAAARAGDAGFPALAEALHDNRRLWTIIAADVSDADNGLPKQLRAQLFYLAEFTTLHTGRVLSGAATVEALIDINAAVMAGLRTERAAA
jgi:flagellar protein FlaF